MKMKVIAAAAALLVMGWTATPGFAADANNDGLPDDPMSNENTIPGPETDTPSDPAADDSPAARVVQMRVVQHREARPPEQIRPDELVRPGVADLIDRDVVLAEPRTPDEIVGAVHPQLARRRRIGRRSPDDIDLGVVDEDVDAVTGGGEERDDLRRAAGDAARLRRPRREPRDAHLGVRSCIAAFSTKSKFCVAHFAHDLERCNTRPDPVIDLDRSGWLNCA